MLQDAPANLSSSSPIPVAAGVGLRLQHMPLLASDADDAPLRAAWLELHSENFLNAGGPRLAMLDEVAVRYPLSCHGVGLSLGSAQGLDAAHLKRLAHLFNRVKPGLISEHLSWSVVDGAYLNDLLPLPYTEETLRVVADNVKHAQDVFGRKLLVENPSSYVQFTASTGPEWEFLSRLVDMSGCGLLLDVNNIYVSATNNGLDAATYLANIPVAAVGEIHLAGHSVDGEGDDQVLIDTHSTYVCDPVWALYAETLRHVGVKPTLMEWDLDVPAFEELQKEAARAQVLMDRAMQGVAHAP
ncbi:MAG: DUF692 domain-containing protein [Rhodospirillaceae bacterium]|nr:DUF692 domain-containing protein [Rhodospirillaceae bacterium]